MNWLIHVRACATTRAHKLAKLAESCGTYASQSVMGPLGRMMRPGQIRSSSDHKWAAVPQHLRELDRELSPRRILRPNEAIAAVTSLAAPNRLHQLSPRDEDCPQVTGGQEERPSHESRHGRTIVDADALARGQKQPCLSKDKPPTVPVARKHMWHTRETKAHASEMMEDSQTRDPAACFGATPSPDVHNLCANRWAGCCHGRRGGFLKVCLRTSESNQPQPNAGRKSKAMLGEKSVIFAFVRFLKGKNSQMSQMHAINVGRRCPFMYVREGTNVHSS